MQPNPRLSLLLSGLLLLGLWPAEPASAYGASSRRHAPRAHRATRFATPGGTIDGIFAAGTEVAVRRYQASIGLPATGIVGPRTQRALGLPAGPALRRGSRGPSVVALQRALWRRGYAPGVVAAPPAASGPIPQRPSLRPFQDDGQMSLPPSWGAAEGLPVLPPDPPLAGLPEPARPVARPPVYEAPEPIDPLDLPPPARPSAAARPEPPGAEPVEASPGRPMIEIGTMTWLVPTAPGATTVDLARPALAGSFTYWRGDWGLEGAVLALPDGVQAFDARARWRDAQGRLGFGLGWRELLLATGPVHTAAGMLEARLPLAGDDAWLEMTGQWGMGLPMVLFGDGFAGLSGRLGPVRLRGGWRGLGVSGVSAAPITGWHGPVVGASLPL